MDLIWLIAIIFLGVPLYMILFPDFSGGIFSDRHVRGVRGLIDNDSGLIVDKNDLKISKAREELLRSVSDSTQKKRETEATLTLRKRLKYAQWPISEFAYHLLECLLSAFMLMAVQEHFNIAVQASSLLFGPIFMGWLVRLIMMRRFKRFDADYPHFLMSMVALLKAGMTQIGALETAAKGLEPKSLVKEEVEIMVERLRLGISEDKSIGTFGEDIFHPEIELFVQAMLLSRRIGGNLSDTLERLARQIRKNQYFRNSAIAAVGMQRGSIWVILALLVGVQCYIYMIHPSMITEGLYDPFGWQVWQGAILLVILGFLWVRKITDIKV